MSSFARPTRRFVPLRAALVALVIAACLLPFGVEPATAQPGALSITAQGPYFGQVGSPVVFMSRFDLGGRPPAETAFEIEWDFGDGAIDQGQTTSHVYTQPGVYSVSVTLRVLAGFQSVTDTTTATITPGQVPGQLTVDAGGPYSGQVGSPVFFMARFDLGGRPPNTAIEIEWDFGDGSVEQGQTTSHVYTRPGTYTVTVTLFVLAGRETATSSTTAQISAAPDQFTVNAGGPYTGMVGQAITMTGSINPPSLAQREWLWNFGDGTTGTGQTVQKTYNSAGTFTVTVEVRPVGGGAAVTTTTTATIGAAQPQDERVPLPAGCSNQALTWPIGTPMGTVAGAVSPPGAVLSIFRLDPVQQRFRGFSPTAPSFANDYTMVETSLEAVFFCLSAPGTLFRPGPGGGSAPAPTLIGPVFRWQETLLNDGQRFVPPDPSRYTLQLMPDGTAAAQADCNRAVGSYTTSGNQLTLSFLATTLAACPPGSLGDRYVQQLNGVNSFFFRDGVLFLEIRFDSGTMRFTQ